MAIRPARIEPATILSVNDDGTCRVRVDSDENVIEHVLVLSMGAHPAGGEGASMEPEQGAQCQLVFPSDGSPPFAVGFIMPKSSGEGRGGGRIPRRGGDIVLATRDGNAVILRRGGVVEIASTGMCKSLYIPLRGLLRHVMQNFEMLSPLGEIRWTHTVLEETETGSNVLLDVATREKVDDKSVSVRVRAGFVGTTMDAGAPSAGGTVLVDLEVDPNGTGRVFSMRVDKAGNIACRPNGWAYWKVGGACYLDAASVVVKSAAGVTLEAGAGVSLSAKGALTVTVPSFVVTAPSVVFSGTVRLGSPGASKPVPDGGALIKALLEHRHIKEGTIPGVTGPLAPSSLPLVQGVVSSNPKVFAE